MSDLASPERISRRERWSQIRASAVNVLRAFRLSWEAHRLSTLGMAACTLIGALLPAAQAWVAKLIVDSVVSSLNRDVDPWMGLQAIAPLLLAEAVLVVLQALNGQLRTLSEHVLHARLNLSINTRIIRKAFCDLYPLRHAEVDGMHRALPRPAAPRKERRRWRPVYSDR